MERHKLIQKVSAKIHKKVKDILPGGADNGSPDSDFDKEQLDKGQEIEMEHTNDPDIAKEIAKDHLVEAPRYYLDEDGGDRLKMLEEEANIEYEEIITKKSSAAAEDSELLEKLAEIEHDQWMEWSKGVAKEVSDERKARWEKYWVPYSDLTEEVKDMDRKYAKKVMKAIKDDLCKCGK